MRKKSALGGLLIYAFSVVFVSYLSFSEQITPQTWIALLWVIILFVSINAAGKSFLQEQKQRMLLYYCLVSPQLFILSRTLYSGFFVSVVTLGVLLIFSGLFPAPVEQWGWFLVGLFLGSFGFAATISFISSIAQAASGNFTMVAILSFPVILPFLITQTKLSLLCLASSPMVEIQKLVAVLTLLNALVMGLSYVLFPYLWRD